MECFGKLFEADPCENVRPAAVCGAGESLPQLRSTGTSPSECQRITNCWIWSKDLQLMSFKHWIEKMDQQKMISSVARFGECQIIFPHVWYIYIYVLHVWYIYIYIHFNLDCYDLPGPGIAP